MTKAKKWRDIFDLLSKQIFKFILLILALLGSVVQMKIQMAYCVNSFLKELILTRRLIMTFEKHKDC